MIALITITILAVTSAMPCAVGDQDCCDQEMFACLGDLSNIDLNDQCALAKLSVDCLSDGSPNCVSEAFSTGCAEYQKDDPSCDIDCNFGSCSTPCGPGTECAVTGQLQECVPADCDDLEAQCLEQPLIKEALLNFNFNFSNPDPEPICAAYSYLMYCGYAVHDQLNECKNEARVERQKTSCQVSVDELGLPCADVCLSSSTPPPGVNPIKPPQCGAITCQGNEKCKVSKKRQCVKVPGYTPSNAPCGTGCGAGTVCSDGTCVLDPCDGVNCGSNGSCKNGVCVTPAAPPTTKCGSDTVLDQGECKCKDPSTPSPPTTSTGRRLVEVAEVIQHFTSFIPGFMVGAMYN